MRWGCQPSLPVPRAGSSPENKMMADITEGLRHRATSVTGPLLGGGWSHGRQVTAKQSQDPVCAAAFPAGAAVTTQGQQLGPGGRQREDRAERTQGGNRSDCLLGAVRQLCPEVEGGRPHAEGWSGPPLVPGSRLPGGEQCHVVAQCPQRLTAAASHLFVSDPFKG